MDIKPLVSLLLLPRRLGDFIATCSNFQSACRRVQVGAAPAAGQSNDRASQTLDQDAAKRDLIVPILPISRSLHVKSRQIDVDYVNDRGNQCLENGHIVKSGQIHGTHSGFPAAG